MSYIQNYTVFYLHVCAYMQYIQNCVIQLKLMTCNVAFGVSYVK